MKKTNYVLPIIIAVLICLGIWTGGMFFTHWYASTHFIVPEGNSKEALFGDSFGAVNALISAFAFAGVILSMYLQRKDLELQRESLDVQKEELKRNTYELALQRQEFETQNKTIKLQRFENTFFNMLSLQQEIVNGLSHSFTKNNANLMDHIRGRQIIEHNIELSGRSVFEYFYNKEVKPIINTEGIGSYFYCECISHFDHYFRHLYRIIKFIDESILLETKPERYSYISILRATLSKYELLFLYYNALGFPNFKNYIEEYSFLNNIDSDSLAFDTPEKIFDQGKDPYDKSAFDPDIKGYNKIKD